MILRSEDDNSFVVFLLVCCGGEVTENEVVRGEFFDGGMVLIFVVGPRGVVGGGSK